MSQPIAKKNFKPGSLRGPRTARTVLLRMAADDERAQRISALKDDRPDLTWRRIAETVGVSERAAFEWKKTGGIDYENAKKLASVFGVDVEFIWAGPKGETPDPFPTSDGDVLARLDAIERSVRDARDEREDQASEVRRLLKEQSELLATIREIVAGLGVPDGVTLEEHLVQMLHEAAAQSGPPSEPPERS